MNMIHAEKLVYEYDKRDEEGNVIGTNRAIDGVDIDVPQGSFVAVLGHNGSAQGFRGLQLTGNQMSKIQRLPR